MNLFQQAVARAKHFRLGLRTEGAARCVRQLFRALPVIDGFATTLLEFKKQFADLEGLDPHRQDVYKRCSKLQFEVDAVVNNYRSLMNGDTRFDDELDDLNQRSVKY